VIEHIGTSSFGLLSAIGHRPSDFSSLLAAQAIDPQKVAAFAFKW
jgi:hypothetical protein